MPQCRKGKRASLVAADRAEEAYIGAEPRQGRGRIRRHAAGCPCDLPAVDLAIAVGQRVDGNDQVDVDIADAHEPWTSHAILTARPAIIALKTMLPMSSTPMAPSCQAG